MADSPVLYVYYRPDNDDAYPGVPNRHITEADWARFSPSQRRTVEQATTQEGYTRRKVWLHRDLVDETEQERADREAAEQAARDAFNRAQRNVKGWEYDTIVTGLPDTIAGIVSTDPAITTAVTAAVGAKIPGDPYEALDIWPEFNANGGGVSWDALTYDSYIAGLDASLSGQISSGAVAKTNLGTASDGTTPVYGYSAGNGPVNVLIVGAQHGYEVVGTWAPMRWFQQFVIANTATMRQFRDTFRVTFIPALNAANYRKQHTNPTGVNLNRNYDFFWTPFVTPSPEYEKGTAAFSEAETRIVRDLLTSQRFSIVMDCHNYNNSTGVDDIKAGYPSDWILSARPLLAMAGEQWVRLYGENDPNRLQLMMSRGGDPTLVNWAQWKMRHDQGQDTSAAVMVESPANLHGSTSTLITREAMRRYNGYITTVLHLWMTQAPSLVARPYAYDVVAMRYVTSGTALTNPVTSNGMTITNTTAAPVAWDYISGDGESSAVGPFTNSIKIIPPYAPAVIVVSAIGTLEAMDATAQTVTMTIQKDGGDTYGTALINLPATVGARENFTIQSMIHLTRRDASSIHRYSLTARTSGGGPRFRRVLLRVTVTPDTEAFAPVPRIPRSY